MRRLLDYRHPAALVLALCLALGGMVQATGALGAFPSSARWQSARDIAVIASARLVSQARAAHPHRSPVGGLQFAGFQVAVALPFAAFSAGRQAPFPRICAVTTRSGRSPPLFS